MEKERHAPEEITTQAFFLLFTLRNNNDIFSNSLKFIPALGRCALRSNIC